MTAVKNKISTSVLSRLSSKELATVKKKFGLTETELNHLLNLGKKYRRNSNQLLKKLLPH